MGDFTVEASSGFAAPAAQKNKISAVQLLWVGAGAGCVILLVVVVLLAAGVFGGANKPAKATTSPTPSAAQSSPAQSQAPVELSGGWFKDEKAGVMYKPPRGWERVKEAELSQGFTSEFVKLVQDRPGRDEDLVAEISGRPLPEDVQYNSLRDLRPACVNLANQYSSYFFPGAHTKVDLGVRTFGHDTGAGFECRFRIDYTEAAAKGWTVKSETASVSVLQRGNGARPGVIFISVPDVLGNAAFDNLSKEVSGF